MLNFEDYFIDLTETDAHKRLVQRLHHIGLVTFEGVKTEEQLLTLCQSIGEVVHDESSNERGLTTIVEQSEPPKGMTYRELINEVPFRFHTEDTSSPLPAQYVVMWCIEPANFGGRAIIGDGRRAYEIVQARYPNALRTLWQKDQGIFHGFKGSILNKLDDRVFIRFGSDADTYYTTSAFTGLQVFLEPMNIQHASFALERSQGYILNNGRYLHGQGAFQGKKVMGRVLMTTDETQHIGFAP